MNPRASTPTTRPRESERHLVRAYRRLSEQDRLRLIEALRALTTKEASA